MKNWKTTAIGCAGAAWIAIQPLIGKGDFDLNRDWKTLLSAGIVAAFSFVAKDFNVTGNPAQTIEPAANAK